MKLSRLSIQKVLSFLTMLWCGVAGAQEAKVRTSLATKGDLWIGQRVALVVELLAPGFFSGVAAFDLPSASSLLLVPPEGSPIISSETIDGASYTVQRHELAVFARHAGEQTIPSFGIRFQFKSNPLDKDAVPATVKTEPVRVTVKLPPGAEKLGSLISARDLKAEEAWKPEPGKAKAGDAFTRSITYTAADVPAMAFPPFPSGKIDGLGIYQKPPEVLDESDRGTLTGKRRDTITYVCQRPGQFVIPATRLTWFDLDAQKLQTIDFPAQTLDVAPNPVLASIRTENESTKPPSKQLAWVAGSVLVLAALAAGAEMLGMRAAARRAAAHFRPVRLQPLNPGEPSIFQQRDAP